MAKTINIQPVNSVIFVSGGGKVDVPVDHLDDTKSPVAASRDCLIICVNPELDGPTALTIGRASEIDPGYSPSFVGPLETRTGHIIIDQVDQHVVHDQVVDSTLVTITAWFSHPRWPEQVFIGID